VDDVYHSRTCYNPGCANAECFVAGFDDNELVYEDCIKKTEQACEIAIRNVCNESKNIDISLALSNKSIIT